MVVWKNESKKKILFRYTVFVSALVLVSQLSLTDTSLRSISLRATEQIASVVGMSVGVPPNETNILAQELRAKELEISERARALDAKERDIRSVVNDEVAKSTRRTLLIFFGVTLFLILLIGTNFYLDYKRRGTKSEDKKEFLAPDPHAHEGEFTTKL